MKDFGSELPAHGQGMHSLVNVVHARVTKSCNERVHEALELLGEQDLYFYTN